MLLLLISCINCQNGVSRDQSCDKNIIQQLKLQNIQYQCESYGISISDQEEIILDLILRDLEIFSVLKIYNITNVFIGNIILENLIIQTNDQFIILEEIENISVQNISISNFKSNDKTLISIQFIKRMQVNLLVLSDLEVEKCLNFDSKNLVVNQIIFQNAIACEFRFFGFLNLSIKDIYVIIDERFIPNNNECFQEYSTTNQINIENIIFDIKELNFLIDVFKFAHFYSEDFYVEGKININQIQYKSLDLRSMLTIILKMGFDFMQILVHNINSIQIKEVIIEGFNSIRQSSSLSLISAINIKQFTIDTIIFKSNNYINGPIFQGQDLNSCSLLWIHRIQAQYDSFRGHLINANYIEYVEFMNIDVENIEFNQYSMFNLKNIGLINFQNLKISKISSQLIQSTIFYIELYKRSQEQLNIFNRNIQADLQSNQSLQFLVLSGNYYKIYIEDSQIMNGSSTSFGGCINLIQPSFGNSQIIISDSQFIKCNSKYSGGAISGIQLLEINNSVLKINNSVFENCSSQIGGALYMVQNNAVDDKYFIENKGYLVANNYNNNQIQLKIDKIFEIVDLNNNQQLILINKFLYPGIAYLIKISIKAEDLWFNTFNQQNYFGNIFDLLINPSNNFLPLTPPQLLNTNFPFLIWYAVDIPFQNRQMIDFEKIQINFVLNQNLFAEQYKIYNGCKKQGMEQQLLQGQINQKFICRYCDNMRVGYEGVCQNCQTDYFSLCYGNYSMLKQTYWRSNYTVNSSDILYCSNSPSSCKGGSGIGNDLCYEGHIGAQCLDCDISGNYWQDKYFQGLQFLA
ncbi:hypothetical protein ABPG72_010204 [Tetrahymena utriculariae]